MTNPPEHAHSRSAGRSSPKRSEAADLGSNPETGWKLGAFGSAGEALLGEGEDQRGGNGGILTTRRRTWEMEWKRVIVWLGSSLGRTREGLVRYVTRAHL